MTRRGTLLAWIREDATTGAPLVPVAWDVIAESDRWWTIYPLGRVARPDVWIDARTMVRSDASTPPRALFVVVGPPAALQVLADRIASDALAFTRTWADLPAFRAYASAPATTIKASWPDERPGGAGTLVALYARVAGYAGDDAEGGAAP